MPDATPDSIRHLDFEVGPVMCGCQGCPAVPRTRQDPPCTSIATHRVAVHAVNDCDAIHRCKSFGLINHAPVSPGSFSAFRWPAVMA